MYSRSRTLFVLYLCISAVALIIAEPDLLLCSTGYIELGVA